MALNDDKNMQVDTRIEWVEPEMIELNVTETAQRPRLGGDGGFQGNPDCSRS